MAGTPALWSIEDARGERLGWLFGTVHALPARVDWNSPELDRAVAQAGVLAVEVKDITDTRMVAKVFGDLAKDRREPPLEDRIAARDRPILAALFDRAGVDPDRFDGLETWAAATAVAQLSQAGDIRQGADHVLETRFSGRPVVELEGLRPQLAIFDQLPERDQRDLLTAIIRASGRAEASAQLMTRAWLAGDLNTLQTVAMQGILEDPELYEALLVQRNAAWAARIGAMMRRGDKPLVAVGAGHMLGPDGLPAVLAADGFTVRRIQ